MSPSQPSLPNAAPSTFFERFLSNHVLTNLVFVLVLVVGMLSYFLMPREQDPTINFNWIDISTVAPGMSAEDVEKRVTDVLEDGIRKVGDIKFVSSRSQDSFSNVLVRFNDLSEREFDKRITDLRREIQNRESELPDAVESPFIFEVTTANAFPTATVVVTGLADDANLRSQADLVKKDLERIRGVDRILETALQQPELQVRFDMQKLESLGISPSQVADTVALQYRDLSAGSKSVGDQTWLVRFARLQADAQALAQVPVLGASGEVRLSQVASVQPGWEKPQHHVLWEGKPAVMLAVNKQASTNTLQLVERIQSYLAQSKDRREAAGVELFLADDQTEITRNALDVMQTNALIGLLMVMVVVWLFLGLKTAFLTSIAIPFVLTGSFWILQSSGETLNVMVLLGIVISLGMLVDDAVVVVESIYYRLERGSPAMLAVKEGLGEVIAPVTAAVLTTMAAFLPLMLLPGIIGEFMRLVPLVVTIALAISLIEAYWILPSHMLRAKLRFDKPSLVQRIRVRVIRSLRRVYTKVLMLLMRVPWLVLLLAVGLFIASLFAAIAGQVNPGLMQNDKVKPFLVKTDFFASDPLRLFYISMEMENGTPLELTLEKVRELQNIVLDEVDPVQRRSVVAYAGQNFTETSALQGSQYGQILVSLPPSAPDLLEVDEVIDSLRDKITQIVGPKKVYFIRLAGGPPTAKAISVKVRGDKVADIRAGVKQVKAILAQTPWAKDVADDDAPGLKEMSLSVKHDALRRSGLVLSDVLRSLRLLTDGEVVAEVREAGETVQIRVQGAQDVSLSSIDRLLDFTLNNAAGQPIALRSVLEYRLAQGFGSIRHYNFRRAITVESDIDKALIDTPQANQIIKDEWAKVAINHPNVSLDFTGQLDDLNESLGSIGKLMLFGVLLMYVILGTQFRSYFQPLMILTTVPMAFTGVVVGLLVTANPLSLFTLYGVVALAGIAVNAAIVLISTANNYLASGVPLVHAAIYAAKRRVVPILITSFTTIAGLFSLATGLGGESLLWGPVATAIVWGLGVSTLMTLFVVPVAYRVFMSRSYLRSANIH